MEKKIVKNLPIISAIDDEVSLTEKFRHHLFAVLKTNDYTAFYILRERGSENLDSTDYFSITISVERGRIVSALNKESANTLRHVIETELNNIACNRSVFIDEKESHLIIHWPDNDEEDGED